MFFRFVPLVLWVPPVPQPFEVLCTPPPVIEQPKSPPAARPGECASVDTDWPIACPAVNWNDCDVVVTDPPCKRECHVNGDVVSIVDHFDDRTYIWQGDVETVCRLGWVETISVDGECVCLFEGECPEWCVSADAPLCGAGA